MSTCSTYPEQRLNAMGSAMRQLEVCLLFHCSAWHQTVQHRGQGGDPLRNGMVKVTNFSDRLAHLTGEGIFGQSTGN